jgi:hypothetical protein
VVLKLRYRVFTFGFMGISNITLYNNLCRKFGEQESYELVEFIHSEVKAEMEEVKSTLDMKTNVFLTKEDKIDLIDRIEVIRVDLIDRINNVGASGRAEAHKTRIEIFIWIVSMNVLQYVLTIITKKFF